MMCSGSTLPPPACSRSLRRLPERFGLLLTRRGSDEELPLGLSRALPGEQVRRLVRKPLSLASLQQIFSSQLGMSFPRPLLARIADASGGNPFFALEIAQATARRKHELSLDEPLAVPRRLEDLIAERVHTLSDPARRAVEGRPSVVLDAHSLYVETLAEIGPVGLALLTVTLAVPIVAAVRGWDDPLAAIALLPMWHTWCTLTQIE
jgi:hypothetical protein